MSARPPAAAELRPPAALRAAVLAGPALAVFSAAFLALQSWRAWGAAEVLEYPHWLPTAAGFIGAVALGGPSAVALRRLIRVSQGPITVSLLQLPFAVFVSLGFSALALLLALRLPHESSYEHLIESGEPVVSAGGAIASAAVVGLIALALVASAAFLYESAVQSNAGLRFAKAADEPDAMGALLSKERQHDRAQPGR